LAYLAVFTGDSSQDGLWVVRTRDGRTTKLDIFGAYLWRDEGRLLVIPLEPGKVGQRLVEANAKTGELRALTDPSATRLNIAGGDWALSADGQRMAFVSADDQNIWILEIGR
jgi:hypothetical protein